MSTPEELRQQAEALAAVATAKRALDTTQTELKRQFHQAVIEAMRQGVSPTAIARAAGLTRGRIYQIAAGDESK